MIRLLAFLTAALGCRIYEEEVSMRKKRQRTGRSWMEMAAGSWSYTWLVPARSLGSTGSLVCHTHRVPTVSPPCPHRRECQDTMASRAGHGPPPQPAPNPAGHRPHCLHLHLPGCPKATSASSSGCNFSIRH